MVPSGPEVPMSDHPDTSDQDPAPLPASLHRRDLLKGLLGAGMASALPALGTGCSGSPEAETARPRERNPELIRLENARQGTRDWLLEKTRIDPATRYRCPWIEGYASRASVRAGESVSFQ